MKKEKFRSSLAPTIEKRIETIDNQLSGKPEKPSIMKKPMMVDSTMQPPEKSKLVNNTDLRYKIGDSYFQRDVLGSTQVSAVTCEMSVLDLGIKKICRRCSREFYTGKRRSLVICPECKIVIKSPKIYEKICPICNEQFNATRIDAITCGKDRCRKALYRKNNS